MGRAVKPSCKEQALGDGGELWSSLQPTIPSEMQMCTEGTNIKMESVDRKQFA